MCYEVLLRAGGLHLKQFLLSRWQELSASGAHTSAERVLQLAVYLAVRRGLLREVLEVVGLLFGHHGEASPQRSRGTDPKLGIGTGCPIILHGGTAIFLALWRALD